MDCYDWYIEKPSGIHDQSLPRNVTVNEYAQELEIRSVVNEDELECGPMPNAMLTLLIVPFYDFYILRES